MPLPRKSETAARKIAALMGDYDDALDDYIEDGGRLPSVSRLLAAVTILVRESVIAGLQQSGAPITARMVEAAVADIMVPIRRETDRAQSQAKAVRRRMPRTPPEDDETEPAGVLIKRLSAGAAVAVLFAGRSDATPNRDA